MDRRVSQLKRDTSTHYPILIKALQLTMGPVLELGSGVFSTPLIHWLCFGKNRPVVTCEYDTRFAVFAQQFVTPTHQLLLQPATELPPRTTQDGRSFDVVFVDHSPERRKGPHIRTRGDDVRLYATTAKYLVLHDGGPCPDQKYGYLPLYEEFEHVFHDTRIHPHTTVLSNFTNLDVQFFNC